MAAKKSSDATRKSATRKPSTGSDRQSVREERAAPDGPYAFHEGVAIVLAGFCAMFLLALISYSSADLPSWVPFSSQAGQNAAVQNFIGPVGAVVAGYTYFFLGAAAYLVPAVLGWWAVQILTGARPFHGRNLASFALLVVSASCLVEYQPWFFQDWATRLNLPKSAGGFVGYGFGYKVVEQLLGSVGSVIVASLIYAISMIVITGIHPFQFLLLLRDGLKEAWSRLLDLGPLIASIRLPSFLQQRPEPAPTSRGRSRTGRMERERFEPLKKEPKPSKPAPAPLDASQPDLFEGERTPPPEPQILDSTQRARKKLTPEEAAGSLFDREKKKAGSLLAGGQFPDYELPSLSILQYADDEAATPTNESELLAQQNMIVTTLSTFGVEVKPGNITRGPTITRYELYPTPGLRVNRITALGADLARATKAERINILAPVPGKDTVGIEIANNEKVPVALRELFEDEAFRDSKAKLPLALGKDVYGRTIVGDLARMPHLLVAGATGSGKSVCINSIIASLLYRFTPDELRFIMVDPKVVEMQLYNDLPHMVIPVVTDPKKVLLALRWVINEMERRYALFAKVGTRNFDGFNTMRARELKDEADAEEAEAQAEAAARSKKGMKTQPELALVHQVSLSDELEEEGFPMLGEEEGEELALPNPRKTRPATSEDLPESLPYIVVIIDELADLMQTAPADVETGIARIAQKARAAGIHLIVATQTPRADVVTGIIKANIPCRIAFQVSSKTDSRIILDANGAENLVGKGDMLYLPPGSAQHVRAQGALITDEEAQLLVEACAAQGKPRFEPEAQEALESGGFGDEGEEINDVDEETLEKCLEVICIEKKASTSLLQRKLRLGYTRAARMIDILESRGIVGPGEGAKPREILIDLSDDFG